MKEITRRWMIFTSMWMIVIGVCFMIYSIIPFQKNEKVVEKQKINISDELKNVTIQKPTNVMCKNNICEVSYEKIKGRERAYEKINGRERV